MALIRLEERLQKLIGVDVDMIKKIKLPKEILVSFLDSLENDTNGNFKKLDSIDFIKKHKLNRDAQLFAHAYSRGVIDTIKAVKDYLKLM
jgi:hypothetical protein